MSLPHLKIAVRDRIRDALGYKDSECEVMEDGRPTPMAGHWFVSIHSGQVRGEDPSSLYERYSLTVTITRRMTHVPMDRRGIVAADNGEIERRAAAIRELVHMDHTLRANASTAIFANTTKSVAGFTGPLEFQTMDSPHVVPSSWFHAEGQGDVGLKIDVQFGNALRIQTRGSAT